MKTLNKRTVAEAARIAMRQRINAGETFTTASLSAIGRELGQNGYQAGSTASNLIQMLKGAGIITKVGETETKAFLWQATEATKPLAVVSPQFEGPYDPKPKHEGRNNGLTEALAEKLWRLIGGGGDGYDEMRDTAKPMEVIGWRRVAFDLVQWFLDRGFVGPAGPRPVKGPLDYAWVYDCAQWAIHDGEGSHVALVGDDQDVPMFLAAPVMEAAILAILARFDEQGGVKRSDIDALRAALPVRPQAPEPTTEENS